MSGAPHDFGGIKLVVFDVDGTLYSQSALRFRMLPELSAQVLSGAGRERLKIIAAYRRLREGFAEKEVEGFDDALIERTAVETRGSPAFVRETIGEWIYRRPLRHLRGCAFAGVPELFAAIKAAGKTIAIYSDYTATGKLSALRLAADLIVSADDPDIAMLKPNPKGLLRLMEQAGALPHETLLIGDRIERDGIAAKRAGVRALIRSSSARPGWQSVRSYRDPVFASLTARAC